MDFNVNKEALCLCESVSQGNAEYSVDCDFTLPEYLPDIVRIIRGVCVPGVQSHQVNGNRASADCTCVIRLLYVCDRGELHCFEQSLSFSKQLELKNAETDNIFVGAKTDYINYKVSGQRRFEVHGVVTVFARATLKKKQNFISSAQGCGITARCESTDCCNLTSAIEKSFNVSETVDPATTSVQINGIISACATPIIDEIKVISNKLFLKAELLVHTCFTVGDSCEISCLDNIISINQIIEAADIDENADVDAVLSLLCLEVKSRFDSATNKNLLDISAVIGFSACGYSTRSITLIKDAYSTKYEAEVKKANISSLCLEEKIEDNFLCRGSCDLGTMGINKIHSLVCNETTSVFSHNGDEFFIRGETTAEIIFEDAKGEITFAEKKLPFEYKKPVQTDKHCLVCQPSCIVTASSFTINDSDKLDIRFEINVNGFVFSQIDEYAVAEIVIDESKPKSNKTASLTVYFAEEKESLWSIAEKYNTTVDAILRENGLNDSVIDKSCKLLIPKM